MKSKHQEIIYEIVNIKTGLTKIISSYDWSAEDLIKIKNFYNNHDDFSIRSWFKRKRVVR